MKIFLAGEVQTNWRKEIIKEFKGVHEFYDPKVKNYSKIDKLNERKAIKEADIVLIKKKQMGKGTRAEIKLCNKLNKEHYICEDVWCMIQLLKEMEFPRWDPDWCCPTCNSKRSYNENHDVFYCKKCDVWLEEACGSEDCDFCTNRPGKPSDIK